MNIDYSQWGLGGALSSPALKLTDLNQEDLAASLQIANAFIRVEDVFLKRAWQVNYYQGACEPSRELIYLRFEKTNSSASHLGNGEYVAMLIDIAQNKIVGMTKMLSSLVSDSFINYTQALENMFVFLRKNAPDLIPLDTKIPLLTESNLLGKKIEFDPGLKLGNLELHWIGGHAETILINKKEICINGIKVKTYYPAKNLWVWGIFAENGDMITFERDVFWDFERCRRETEMWLHDKWLIAHGYC